MNFCAPAAKILGIEIVRSNNPDAELGKIEPTPGGWKPNALKNKERGSPASTPNTGTPTPPDFTVPQESKSPQQAETKRVRICQPLTMTYK
jgi:hypothetical protein